MAGKLTTHALDLVLGCGAGGLTVHVRRLGPEAADLGTVVLDEGGRAVLAEGEGLQAGVHELTFAVGDYHRARGLVGGLAGAAAFLDEVPVRFAVADATSHTHVPLLISLYGYSTYRGG
jgi:5-hydroxyisourate hydrolase